MEGLTVPESQKINLRVQTTSVQQVLNCNPLQPLLDFEECYTTKPLIFFYKSFPTIRNFYIYKTIGVPQ